MKTAEDLQSCRYELSENGKGEVTLRIQGQLDVSNSADLINRLNKWFKDRQPREFTVDLGALTHLDDFGVLALVQTRRLVAEREATFHLKNLSDNVTEMLRFFHFDSLAKKPPFAKKHRPGMLIRLGDGTIHVASEFRSLATFLGAVCLGLLHACRHPRSLRTDDTFLYMQKTGVDALPIIVLISFLVGLIMAFTAAVQLEQFGANIYVASLVSLMMTRELGPIMTAIIVAGRSGSAFAAEIGTMKVSEEVDALFTMGFDTVRFLAVPKIVATVLVVPLLTLFSDLFAILGGLVVGVFMLDLTVNSYVAQTIKTLTVFDVSFGLSKSVIFAFLIAWIGCFRGFQVKGGAASVGESTTSAVVSGIFLIILSDAIFSVILRYWG
ncbi:MAG: MlaE family lipid ABC transporter permease subunit [Deltaproteobacteria bacterium]|nr:MlaE family lipid ABC transporter permease subunit [Deltaproteobacteria bacterium]